MRYDHQKIEKKWQQLWEQEQMFAAKDDAVGERRYILDMFPYPSAAGLHVGHPEGYTATDIYARYLRMQGVNVLHPMGWDAFGLPTENFAIKTGRHPQEIVEENINTFRRQIKALGFSYDWSREVSTADPSYYKWTQWLFLKLYEKGLAYRKEAPVNWCPSCQTVLANEQVINGQCERCGSAVEQKMMAQWFFKITDYADRLLDGLDRLDWPKPIAEMQKHWIGRSEGAEVDFPVTFAGAKPNFLILHGYTGSAKKNFIPWLKAELEQRGYSVQSPELPNTRHPEEAEQVGHVLGNCNIDDNTIIIGHSLGAVVAMKALLQHDKPVRGLILVAAALDPTFSKPEPRPFHATFSWDIDYQRLRNLAGFRLVVSDLNEYDRRGRYLESLAKKIDAQVVAGYSSQEHFVDKQEPLVLQTTIPSIRIFTTRLDTIFGATYVVLAPEHELVQQLKQQVTNWPEVEAYIEQAKRKTELERKVEEKEKTGVKLEGMMAVNPANQECIPVYIADYVLASYGTGAIMAVPAHDQRDWEFAHHFNLPIRQVICPNYPEPTCLVLTTAYVGDGHLIDSGEFDGLPSEKARGVIVEKLKATAKVQYKLRDWLISRQRYWGAPIPIIYCEACSTVPVPERDLPVLLPDDVNFRPTGESPLTRSASFHNVKCPRCGQPARRESDTMDTFVDSSWYFLRYCDPKNVTAIFDKKKVAAWCPINLYVGGAEHAVMHLLYARFITKVLADLGYIDFQEPFLKLKNQGLILGEDGQKMSKSRGNVVNPDDIVAAYGADTFRLYEMFLGPLEDAKPWNTASIAGVRRFLERVWHLVLDQHQESLKSGHEERNELRYLVAKTIKKVTHDIETFAFNTALSAMMEFTNYLYAKRDVDVPEKLEAQRTLLLLLSPFAPHITAELWERTGFPKTVPIWSESWPILDESALRQDTVIVVVQVNGKLRGQVDVSVQLSEEKLVAAARAEQNVAKWLSGKTIIKTVVRSGKLVNFVIEG